MLHTHTGANSVRRHTGLQFLLEKVDLNVSEITIGLTAFHLQVFFTTSGVGTTCSMGPRLAEWMPCLPDPACGGGQEGQGGVSMGPIWSMWPTMCHSSHLWTGPMPQPSLTTPDRRYISGLNLAHRFKLSLEECHSSESAFYWLQYWHGQFETLTTDNVYSPVEDEISAIKYNYLDLRDPDKSGR